MSKEWNKVESAIFPFADVGETLEGIYIGKELDATYENEVYKIRTISGTYSVFGTVILKSKMAYVPEGAEVKIEFKGFIKSKKKGHSDIKDFDVWYR